MSANSIQHRPLLRLLRALGLAGHFLVTPAVVLPLLLLLKVAETADSRFIALGMLFLWLAGLGLWLLCFQRIRRVAALVLGGLIALACALLLTAFLRRPSGPPVGGNFTQHYSGDATFQRASIVNLVPEIDQLKFGTYAIGGADPVLAASGTERLRNLVLKVYREAEADPSFRNAGSALGFCYEDILLGRRKLLHVNQYVPRHLGRERYPVMIFLHGSLGNVQGYTWVLKRFSDQTGIAVVAPTYGAGNWRSDAEGEVVKATLAYCASQADLDASQPYLAGLSNGGVGVTRQIARGGTDWAGVILISPVLETQEVGNDAFIVQARQLPILILHGETDDRIPIAYIQERSATLSTNGALVTERYFPGEDHFLLYSQPDAVTEAMVTWLQTTFPGPPKE